MGINLFSEDINMLDQSFSAYNFETIYCLESRKGNINVQTMPEQYREVLVNLEEIKRNLSILKHKKNKTQDEMLELDAKKTEFKNLVEQKKDVLRNYLETLDKQINAYGFKFSLNKFVADNDKEVYTLDIASHTHLFAIKQLQYNIRHTFKVKQSNRHSILANVKTFLNSNIPVYVIRTDISSFYESIPHNRLMPMIFGNTLLSNKSKAFIKGILGEYENIKDHALVSPFQGIPRGIGISSYLSELYMRDIDTNIACRKEVMYYARYVDDIFIILTSLPVGTSIDQYYADMTRFFQTYGLSLKQPGDESGKCRIIDFTKDNCVEAPMNYLGYCLYMNRNTKKLSVVYGLSDTKKARYRKKIDNAINHFETLCKCNIKQAYCDLFDSLNMITGNFKLFKSKSSVKVGLFYNNDLLDRKEDLDELTIYLKEHPIEPYAGLKDCTNVKAKLVKRISSIDFKQRWQERKMFSFSLQRIQEIEEWL